MCIQMLLIHSIVICCILCTILKVAKSFGLINVQICINYSRGIPGVDWKDNSDDNKMTTVYYNTYDSNSNSTLGKELQYRTCTMQKPT